MIQQSQAKNYGYDFEERLTPAVAPVKRMLAMVLERLRVALPAVVIEFQPGPPPTVTVQIATREYVEQNQQAANVDSPTDIVNLSTPPTALPQLFDVPVLYPKGGGWNVTMPIQPGDECLVVFADTAIDSWLQNGAPESGGAAQTQVPTSIRRHSLSDGIAVFGLWSTPRSISGWSTTSMQIRNDDASVVIDLAEAGVTVTAPAVTVNATSGKVSITGATEVDIHGANKVQIDGSGTTIIEGKDFLGHSHSGVQIGAAHTGGVV